MAILEVKNVCKSFGDNEVLKGVNFSMEQGEIISILGSSGSGKTTLLRCINFFDATKGQIFVDGECVFDDNEGKIPEKVRRKRQLNFGLVFQSFNLFPQYNVLKNVTLAPVLLAKERSDYKKNKKSILAEIDRKAKELLDRVGLGEKLDAYPCELSGGQQQRVSIARALALEPKILFFDEPTSALDPEITNEILKVIKGLAERKTTMIIVTHEIEFAKSVSDRIIFMNGGVVLEDGTPDEVINHPKNERTKAFLSKML